MLTCCGWAGCRRRGSRPPEIRDLRELTRYRQKLVGLRSSCKDQVHAVLAKLGIAVTCSDLFGVWGSAWMDGLRLPQPYAGKVTSLRQLIGELNTEITMLNEVIADLLAGHHGYRVIQRLPGIGPVLAAVIIAEIGDVTRFRDRGAAGQLGRADPEAPRVRYQCHPRACHQAGFEAAAVGADRGDPARPAGSWPGDARDAIIARRGTQARNIAKVAAARRLLTLVYYGLRDGQIRCLPEPAAAA